MRLVKGLEMRLVCLYVFNEFYFINILCKEIWCFMFRFNVIFNYVYESFYNCVMVSG